MPAALSQFLTGLAPGWMPFVFLLGVTLLLFGGHWLVTGAVRLARGFGLSTLFIGLTIVAFGTSAPELFLNLTAALGGAIGLSFGNVVGSNIANIALVLAVTAIVGGGVIIPKLVAMWELPWLLVTSFGLLVLAGLGAAGIDRIDGIILLAGFLALLLGWWQRRAKHPEEADVDEAVSVEPAATRSARLGAVGLFVVGLAGLIIGADGAKVGAVGLAEWWGVPEAIIGLTIVAIATSLPELVASVIAVRAGHGDLAVGNIVGSNLFNILLVLGATAAVKDVPIPGDPAWGGLTDGWLSLIVMIVVTVALVPFAMTGNMNRRFGVIMLLGYFAYMASVTLL